MVISFHLTDAYLPASGSVSKQSVNIAISPRVPSTEEHQSLQVQILHSPAEVKDVPGERTTVLLDQTLYGSVEGDAIWSIDRENKMLVGISCLQSFLFF